MAVFFQGGVGGDECSLCRLGCVYMWCLQQKPNGVKWKIENKHTQYMLPPMFPSTSLISAFSLFHWWTHLAALFLMQGNQTLNMFNREATMQCSRYITNLKEFVLISNAFTENCPRFCSTWHTLTHTHTHTPTHRPPRPTPNPPPPPRRTQNKKQTTVTAEQGLQHSSLQYKS